MTLKTPLFRKSKKTDFFNENMQNRVVQKKSQVLAVNDGKNGGCFYLLQKKI